MSRKYKCIFCKHLYVDIVRHEDNCIKQFDVLIGPDYEKVRCKECGFCQYKEDAIHWVYYQDKLVKRITYGIWKHMKVSHKILNNIQDYYEPIINSLEIEEPKEKIVIESTRIQRIPEYNYNIDENGIVYNLKGKEIKPGISTNGAYTMTLSSYGGRTRKQLSYFVALTYLENPNNYEHVKHKDGNRINNHYTNLEWVDKKECIKL